VLQGIEEARKAWRAIRQPEGEFHIAEPYESLFYSAVAEVYSAGFLTDGTFYVVMEFVDGVTLKDWLSENQLPIGRRFYIAEALTERCTMGEIRDFSWRFTLEKCHDPD
jgi:serine/threonine protein kinase